VQIRDFAFSPEDGRIVSIKWDALGNPATPQALISMSSCHVNEVVAVDLVRVVLRRNPRIVRESDGLLDGAVQLLAQIPVGNWGSVRFASNAIIMPCCILHCQTL
jgi:hypothetical protein